MQGGGVFVILLRKDFNIIAFIKLRGCIKYMTSIAESNSLIRNYSFFKLKNGNINTLFQSTKCITCLFNIREGG